MTRFLHISIDTYLHYCHFIF